MKITISLGSPHVGTKPSRIKKRWIRRLLRLVPVCQKCWYKESYPIHPICGDEIRYPGTCSHHDFRLTLANCGNISNDGSVCTRQPGHDPNWHWNEAERIETFKSLLAKQRGA